MTNDEADWLISIAISECDRKEYRQAALHLENVAANCPHLGLKALATFNLGAMCWSEIGDGESARKHFSAIAEIVRNAPPGADLDEVQCRWANACENLMLLSLSFDEYEKWAAELDSIEPTNAILKEQRPFMQNSRDKGRPWSAMLFVIASTYYNRGDPSKDRGRYACALATYRLMLGHRKALRLNRDDWGFVTYEVGALAMRMVADCNFALRNKGRPFDHTEFNFIAKDTLPLVEEYMAAYPDDQNNSTMLNNLSGYIQTEEEANDQFQAELGAKLPPSSFLTSHQPVMLSPRRPSPGKPIAPRHAFPVYISCFVIGCVVIWAGLGAGIGALVDLAAGTENGKFWGMGACAGLAGMIIVFALVAQKRV